jgi:hypothetical protein
MHLLIWGSFLICLPRCEQNERAKAAQKWGKDEEKD